MNMYTMEQWEHDNDFGATPGQEIEEAIYNSMLDILPPLHLPRKTARRADDELNLYITGGFLMGEPNSTGAEGLLYRAFGCTGSDETRHFYYLGLSTADGGAQ